MRRQYLYSGGFTLIELSVVLVIIGLIAGGILLGQDLIHAAELRATIAQIEQFESGVNTFKTKYGCLPGDCADAASVGFDPTTAGTGDGLIGALPGAGACAYLLGGCSDQVVGEYTNFWYHLSIAAFIPYHIKPFDPINFNDSFYTGIASPPAKIARLYSSNGLPVNGWAVHIEARFLPAALPVDYLPTHNMVLGSAYTYPSGLFTGYAPIDIKVIDDKIDDGMPLSGRARSGGGGSSIMGGVITYNYNMLGVGPGGGSNAYCVRNDTTPYQYNIQYRGGAASAGVGNCALVVKASF